MIRVVWGGLAGPIKPGSEPPGRLARLPGVSSPGMSRRSTSRGTGNPPTQASAHGSSGSSSRPSGVRPTSHHRQSNPARRHRPALSVAGCNGGVAKATRVADLAWEGTID